MHAVPPAHQCANHPTVPTGATCARCGRPFCESCLTELMGSRVCGWCRDLQLQRFQPAAAVNARTVVLWARIFDWVMLAGGIAMSVLLALYFGVIAWGITQPGPGGPAPGTVATPNSIPDSMLMFVAISAVIVLLGVVLYLPPAVGLGPGRPWLWTWQMAALVISVLGGCLTMGYLGIFALVPAIVLWIYWVKPEVRAYCERPDGG